MYLAEHAVPIAITCDMATMKKTPYPIVEWIPVAYFTKELMQI